MMIEEATNTQFTNLAADQTPTEGTPTEGSPTEGTPTEEEAAAAPEGETAFADAYSPEDDADLEAELAELPDDAVLEEIEEEEPEDEGPVDPGFDLKDAEALSFAMLQDAQGKVYRSRRSVDAFRTSVMELANSGEEGRRKGLGMWVLEEHEECVNRLAEYEGDDTAAFTRARSLVSLGRLDESLAIFRRLSEAYPNEPRPRAGHLDAIVEMELANPESDSQALAARIDEEIAAAPEGFAESAEGQHLAGRAAEMRRDWNTALDHFDAGRAADPTHRENLASLGFLAERCGLDDLALKAYETLLSVPPVNRQVLMNLGILYEDLGRDQDAAACYHTVSKDCPTDLQARLYLGDARAAMEMYYDEDLEKKEDRLNQILRIPITDFELSVRARNCLNKMEINTLGDLVARTEQELLSYKNFGETSLTEIKEILHSKCLRLGMPRDEAVASIEAQNNRTAPSESSDIMDRPIMDLQLSIRARRTVETLGCLTVGDVMRHSIDELLGMPNFGQTSLQELRSKLAEIGLKLNGE